jgi:hypothetical protein
MSEVVLILLEPTDYDLPTGLLAAIGVLLRVQAQGFPGGFQSAKESGVRDTGARTEKQRQKAKISCHVQSQ